VLVKSKKLWSEVIPSSRNRRTYRATISDRINSCAYSALLCLSSVVCDACIVAKLYVLPDSFLNKQIQGGPKKVSTYCTFFIPSLTI